MAEKNAAGRIALFYAVIGCIWILFSDQLVALLFPDPSTSLLVSQFKGWGFIAFTALLLYWLIRDSREQLVRSEAELRRKSTALAENREMLLRYELLANNSRDIILFLRRDDGRILEANAAAMAAYGFDHQELLAMTIQELRAPDVSAETPTLMAAVDARGLLFETVHCRKDGSTFPVEVSSQGATIGDTRTLISVIRDITQRRQAEESLRLWADAFDACAHGMAIGNPATNTILACNPAFARMHGQTVGEISGTTILSLYAPAERDHVRQLIAEADQSGKVRYESVMQRRDNSRFPVQVDLVSVRAVDGQLHHRVATVQDITERKEAQEALLRSEAQHRLALTAARLGTWCHDLLTGLVHLDELARDHYAISGAAVPLADILDRVHPEDAARLKQEIAAALDPIGSNGQVATEYRLILPDGAVRCLSVHVSVRFSTGDNEPRPLYAIGTSQDITERKLLDERTAHLASFPKLNPTPVLEADTMGRVVFCNAAAMQVLQGCGMGDEEAARFLPADLDRILAEWDMTSEAVLDREVAIGERFFGESVFLSPQFKVVRIYAYEVTQRKRAEAALKQAYDDLERRVAERTAELAGALDSLKAETAERIRAEEELREKERLLMHQSRLAALGEMIGNIAHQWRQPLNSLTLLIQHAKQLYDSDSLTDEEAAEASEQAMSLIGHMSQTIDDFRNFFRPDKEKAEFSVQDAVTRAVALIEDSLRELRVAVDIRCEGEYRVTGYINEYSQVLLNILLNARDAFTEQPRSDPRITIRTFAANGRVVVTITDNAGGIPQEVIGHIFEPYFSTKGVQGTGIGLYMAKTIIEKNMFGTLTAGNTGNGAEFRIEV
jgi:PAS domain S-box-containing protein